MESRSKQKHIIMSPRKIRRVANEVRGKDVVAASNMLNFMPYAAARIVEKNLKAAVANAEMRWQLRPEELCITEIFVDEGPRFRRFKPRAQGRIYMRIKRTSHVTVCVGIKNKKNG